MLDFKVFDVASQICVAVFTEVIPSPAGDLGHCAKTIVHPSGPDPSLRSG